MPDRAQSPRAPVNLIARSGFSRRAFVSTVATMVGGACFGRNERTSETDVRPATGPLILFQGDSITEAWRDPRVLVANSRLGLGRGYPFILASALRAAYPERDYRLLNRGVSGNRVSDLQRRWNDDTISLSPDLLSILIGVNDFRLRGRPDSGATKESFESRYRALLDATRSVLTRTRLVLVEPFLLRTNDIAHAWFAEFDYYRAVVARLASDFDATFVPLQDHFDLLSNRRPPVYWAADGVHPTLAGHAAIADRWRNLVALD